MWSSREGDGSFTLFIYRERYTTSLLEFINFIPKVNRSRGDSNIFQNKGWNFSTFSIVESLKFKPLKAGYFNKVEK